MRILVLGAGGFIGREVFAALSSRGHDVIAGVRDAHSSPPFANSMLPLDLNELVDPKDWLPRLRGIDAIVNCAGILQQRRGQSMTAIHLTAPRALYRACEQTAVRRVVHVSAISADQAADTDYARTKLAAEEALRASSLDWVVIRPSLVHARSAYGGTAFMRAVAALPFAIPVPGRGDQAFQPIFIDDLCEVVAEAVEGQRLVRQSIDLVGPQRVTLKEMLVDYRQWLGLRPAPIVSVASAIARAAARVGDLFGGPLNSTSYRQLEYGNVGDYEACRLATGLEAAGWRQALASHPSHAQERWHARLYFVRPLLRATLAALWLVSGSVGLAVAADWGPRLSDTASPVLWTALIIAGCVIDLALGLLLLLRPATRGLALAQFGMVAAYTLVATLLAPGLWLQPFGPLLKNIPVLAAILALGATEQR